MSNRTLIWGERDALEDDIYRSLREWIFSDTPPSWSDAELFTICVLIVSPSSLGRMREWLKHQFLWCSNGARSIDFIRSEKNAIKLTEVAPVRQFEDFNRVRGRKGTMCFRLVGAVHATRLFLQNVLRLSSYHAGSSRRDIFSTLPTELRVMILEDVLVVPQSQVFLRFNRVDQRTRLITVQSKRNNATTTSTLLTFEPYESKSHDVSHQHSADVLAVLAVSRRIYQEAMPIFFGKNIFTCTTVGTLCQFLRSTAPARRDCIRHVAFACNLGSHEMSFVSQCSKTMKNMENLRRLDINFHDWVSPFSYGQLPEVIDDLLKLPGFQSLLSLRLQEVNIYGGCPAIKAYCAQMVKVKANEELKKPVRKRKAEDAFLDVEARS
jgi:hypothetical protein